MKPLLALVIALPACGLIPGTLPRIVYHRALAILTALCLSGCVAAGQMLHNQTISGGIHINLSGKNVSITNCTFYGGGVLIYGGGIPRSETIDVERCMFLNCSTAFQLNGVIYDPNITFRYNQIEATDYTPLNDQISVYNSSGSLVRMIVIDHNYVRGLVQVKEAGGIVMDWHSNYVVASDNVCIGTDMTMGWAGGLTKIFAGNTIVGIGMPGEWTFGMAIVPNAGYALGNVVGWINGVGGMNNYVVEGGSKTLIEAPENGNINLPQELVTEDYEQALYWRWANELVAAGAWPVGNQP